MKNTIFLIIAIGMCVIVSFIAVSPLSGATQEKNAAVNTDNFKIGFIKDRSLPEGCSCTFSTPSQRRRTDPQYLFVSDIEDEEKTAWLNIDGRDVELKLLSSRNPRTERVGSRSTRIYAGAGLKVVATYITTWLCPPKDEACEVTRYDGVFKVTKAGTTRTLRLKGDCGC
ncbi:MAG: hypothetical protein ABJC05_12555 [Pyrinomonadaceae bacterium]